MAVTARDARLDTRAARLRLPERREPYFKTIHEGCAVGYRRGSRGGSWIARHYDPEHRQRYSALGIADDRADADGIAVLSFQQAQEKAREWFAELARVDAGETVRGPYTVGQALDDYLAAYERKGGKAKTHTNAAIEAHIRPVLGALDASRLTRSRIEQWFEGVADAPARRRKNKAGKTAKAKASKAPVAPAETKRRRRASANRVLNILKAALNHAHQRRRIAADDSWKSVKSFREVDAPVVRYLTDAECKRLVNACTPDFRQLVRAALLTGCRYGELIALRAADFDSDAGTLAVRQTKSGKPRHVVLADEGRRFFTEVTAGEDGSALIFTKLVITKSKDGGADEQVHRPWGKSHAQRPMSDACTRAKITPAVRPHDLRHTHAATLAMKGVPMAVIAAQLGHADTRMTERHYAHLSPTYVAETIRANFPDLGIVPKSNVRRLARGNTNA